MSIWYQGGVNLVSTLGEPWVNLESTWGQPGVNLVSTWCQPGVIMGSTWCQPGVKLGSASGQAGVKLQPPNLGRHIADSAHHTGTLRRDCLTILQLEHDLLGETEVGEFYGRGVVLV